MRAAGVAYEYQKILKGEYVEAKGGGYGGDPILAIKNELIAKGGADLVYDLEEIDSFLKKKRIKKAPSEEKE